MAPPAIALGHGREAGAARPREAPAGPSGEAGLAGATIRVVSGDGKAACGDGESMISAYCVGDNATAHVSGMSGASCEGQGAKAVIACLKK
jgi:hypothetical protein